MFHKAKSIRFPFCFLFIYFDFIWKKRWGGSCCLFRPIHHKKHKKGLWWSDGGVVLYCNEFIINFSVSFRFFLRISILIIKWTRIGQIIGWQPKKYSLLCFFFLLLLLFGRVTISIPLCIDIWGGEREVIWLFFYVDEVNKKFSLHFCQT